MSVNYKDEVRVKHTLDAINQLISISTDKSFETLKSDIIYQLASIKLLEIIGEASNHISNSTKDKFPDIPWRELNGLRNILVHEYFGVDLFTIWDIIDNSIHDLKVQFNSVLFFLTENN